MSYDKESEPISFLSHIISQEKVRKARVQEAENNPNPLFPAEDIEKFDPEEVLEPDENEEDVDQESRVISRVKGQNKPISAPWKQVENVKRSSMEDDMKASKEPTKEALSVITINQIFEDGSTSPFKPEYEAQLTRSIPWEVRDEERLEWEARRDLERAIQDAGIILDKSSMIRLGVYLGRDNDIDKELESS